VLEVSQIFDLFKSRLIKEHQILRILKAIFKRMNSALQDDQIKAMQTIPSFGRRTSTKYSTPETGTVLLPSSAIKKIFLHLMITFETPKIKVIT
jgi:hypothetical protein